MNYNCLHYALPLSSHYVFPFFLTIYFLPLSSHCLSLLPSLYISFQYQFCVFPFFPHSICPSTILSLSFISSLTLYVLLLSSQSFLSSLAIYVLPFSFTTSFIYLLTSAIFPPFCLIRTFLSTLSISFLSRIVTSFLSSLTMFYIFAAYFT